MKYIPLTQGQKAMVDDLDYDRLIKHRWQYHTGYADSAQGKMQRVILSAPKGTRVIYINGNKLDNRRINLRIENKLIKHRATRRDNTSGFKGISYNKARMCWVSRIQVGNKRIYVGNFKSKGEAIVAHQRAIMEYGS